MRPDRAIVKKAILDAAGNLTRAAALLGCSRTSLYTWIYQLGLERMAGVCQDTRVELDRRERKDSGVTKENNPGVQSSGVDPPTLRLVGQQALVEMPVNATVKLPESLWKRVRKTAIDRDCTVSQLVESALEAALASDGKARKRGGNGE